MTTPLEARVRAVYSYLHMLYRQGGFEVELKSYRYGWPELDNNDEFYNYQAPAEDIGFIITKIKYTEAIENLYQLILFLEQDRTSWTKEYEVEVLEIKNLIYKVKDYSLAVPPELGQFFLDQARQFSERVKNNEVERFADELRGEAAAPREPDDARARVIKVQIIAALCGVNHLYRLHIHGNDEEALEIVENIETYVKRELPGQHRNKRRSFGLLGLTLYLKGRLLSACGDYDNAQKAYAQSNDAYVARLDQKKDFYNRGYINREEYEEKQVVTLRRVALVSAMGVGYLAFINSRISKALAALRASRAALKQNAGAVYEAYTDVLFFACRRAEGSSESETLEDVIYGIEACRATLSELVPDSHYLHRAGIELAIALHYRVKSRQKASEGTDHAFKDYTRAMELLESAIKHAETIEDDRYKNQRLLTEALFIRSYIRRYLPGITPDKRRSTLLRAEEDAKRSLKEATGNSRMECEALIALGSVQFEQARYFKSIGKGGEFYRKLNASRQSFGAALTRNDKRNVRIEAVCYLKLTKLSLFDPSGLTSAQDNFKRWKEIENRVEHAFCHYMAHDMAEEISRRLSEEGPVLIVDAEVSMNYDDWKDKLLMHLINNMLIQLSSEAKKYRYNEKELPSKIVDALIERLGFKKTTAYNTLEKYGLVEKLQTRNK